MTTITEENKRRALQSCITKTGPDGFPDPYRGKVRDVYNLTEELIGIVVTDRISAFDHIMKQAIPYKGQILNRLSAFGFENVEDILPTHVVDVPHPNVTIAKKCKTIPVEVVIRAYLTGHAWRTYKAGKRQLCGVRLPDGMTEHQKFTKPVLTPATKAAEGHDEDISEADILRRKMVSPQLWKEIRTKAFQLFERGSAIAAAQGLLLVDTKYEFGLFDGELILIDEVHTSDSSRYFYAEGYEERLGNNEPQKQLSKEFLREWLMEQGFQGLENQELPDLPDQFRWSIFQRYSELYETLTEKKFTPHPVTNFDRELKDVFSSYVQGKFR
ncbi:MAG: phosphoribosylaminoimidazolesuccinocarboxamide synthase [Balneolaceae bacterium]